MTVWTLVRRSLRHHRRSHLGVILGAAVGSAALIGALVVGDSVQLSLREMALARLGQVQVALSAHDRLFRDALASELETDIGRPVAPVLRIPGTGANNDGTARANKVQVLGVDQRFWKFASAPVNHAARDEVVLNASLAGQLKVGRGDSVLLRVQKPSLLSREAPVSPQEDFNVSWRATVSAVVSDQQLGRFSLQANQVPPHNAFVPLQFLQEKLETEGRANTLLVGGDTGTGSVRTDAVQAALARVWQLADSELQLNAVTNGAGFDLQTRRVFMDPPVVRAATAISPEARPILTYFVNELRIGDRSTPYSMVAGLAPPMVAADLSDDEILVSPWLADDLQARPGDVLQLTYYVVAGGQRLRETNENFRVRGTVPFTGVYADRNLTPDFPGVVKAESTREWDAGFPIDLGKIREKDETYWTDHRGTPKAFVTLAAAQKMWGNRFGEVTSIRFPAGSDPGMIAAGMRKLDPASVGLSFAPVREQALAAANPPVSFGQLFLGFSFFLIAAALVLMGLLFQLSLEQRATEVGTLLALGFPRGRVRAVMMMEGTVLAFWGGLLGVGGGLVYAKAMLYGLATVWRDAVSTSALSFHWTGSTLLIGLVSSILVSAITVALVLRQQGRQPARDLLAQGSLGSGSTATVKPSRGIYAGLGAGLAGIALAAWAMGQPSTIMVPSFFGAGALFLISGLGFGAEVLARLGRSASRARMTIASLGLRNCTRQRQRSLATATLLACGSFIVVAVGANKLDATQDAEKRGSGTGGFALIGESTLPVVHDLNGQDGREFFGLDEADLQGVAVVPFRVRDGDDASCLNLNQAQTPRLLGVRPESLRTREAFQFAKVWGGGTKDWSLLEEEQEDGAIPAIGDQNSIQWALRRGLGDTLTFADERGQSFQVRLVGGLKNSVMQGNLIIDERLFTRRFPGESGYRMFLVDAPPASASAVSETLTRALQDVGLELTPAAQRLDAFNAVQNTYLRTFQILGGLGLLLGSAGLGVVVLRNVLERRSELAVLRAVGFRRGRVQWLVLSEHVGLLLLGLTVGMVAAVVAVFPVLVGPGSEVHYVSLSATLCGVLLSGLLWTALATWLALRGDLLSALRSE